MSSTHVDALRTTWRGSREHYKAQAFRLLSIVGGLVVSQVVNDYIAGKPLFADVTDRRSLLSYLVGVGYLAWRQLHPALTASAVDSAPGATIVPEQVGAAPETAPLPEAPDDTIDVANIPADLPDA